MVNSFLEHIAKEILSNRKRMDGLTIVLPSKRSIVFLKHHLSQKIDEPIWLPKIYSIEDFITELSGLHTLDNLLLRGGVLDSEMKAQAKGDGRLNIGLTSKLPSSKKDLWRI